MTFKPDYAGTIPRPAVAVPERRIEPEPERVRWARAHRWALVWAAIALLALGLALLAGFAFHEAGMITPLDGLYEWAHTTFGGMEAPAAVAWLDKWMW